MGRPGIVMMLPQTLPDDAEIEESGFAIADIEEAAEQAGYSDADDDLLDI